MYPMISKINLFILVPALMLALVISCKPVEKLILADENLRWEADIQVIDSLNDVEYSDENTLLVTGSSSVRLWDSIHIDLPPYQALVDEVAALDDMRFITQERYDLVKKNMTMDEVKEIAGYPYYQNIQKDEKRGVETWLYRKRGGGAAAVYFKMKTQKAYNKNFEAVKMKVVED